MTDQPPSPEVQKLLAALRTIRFCAVDRDIRQLADQAIKDHEKGNEKP